MKSKEVIQYGINRPIRLRLSNRHFDVLFSMAHMEGREVEDLAKEFMELHIRDLVRTELEACESCYGKLLLQGWLDTIDGK